MSSRISRATAERIRDAWLGTPRPKSPKEAMRIAGLTGNDDRNMRRYRREAERILGISLPSLNPEHLDAADEVGCPSYLDYKAAKAHKLFVITCATNNSNLNERFFDTLENFCDAKDAQLLVCPIKYWHSALMGKKDYRWPERIYPYAMTDKDLILNKSIQVSALKLHATAVNPLSGLQANSGSRSAVYGHTQVALEPVATPGNEDPKIITTTGSCTSATYTKTKRGGKAKFHHSFSACIVRVVGNKFYLTQFHWDGKGAYFGDEYWTPSGHTGGHSAAALVQGDSHAVYSEQPLLDARKRVMGVIDPEALVWHDLHDHKYQSHHNTRFDKIRLARNGEWLVEDELYKSTELLNDFGKGRMNLIVGSNHNDALDKWLHKFNPDHDPHNAVFAWDLGAATIKSGKPAYDTWAADKITVKHKFLDRNHAYKIKGTDVAQHSDIGANGARGSAVAFSKFSNKTAIGHGHAVRINKGCYQGGVSCMGMGYRQGYSSWSYGDVVIYPNGKRGVIYYIDMKSIFDF